jgi:hypothetical protein
MRIAIRLGLIAACLLIPGIAAADDSGFYLGLGLGATQASKASFSKDVFSRNFSQGVLPTSPDFTYSSSLDSTGGRLEAGYWFNPYVGEQVSIVDLGQYSALSTIGCPGKPCGVSTLDAPRLKARGATFAITGRWPVFSAFDLIGRLGLAYTQTTYDEDVSALTSTGSLPPSHHVESGVAEVYGASLGWNFRPHWELLLGGDLYAGLAGDRFFRFNVRLFSLGIQYHF